ncbi:GntR family transcriptional regulator [Streptomyces sp. H10-C2]|uniref:GntR family transcriptional regulator n=1 Tax=unclassified Streptomyces TaxID=2593676 RepID=UPI0022AFC39C|nr:MULTISPECIES: GntR family transcriptional regulator [unclassified Streptomyces]MCZ4102669.1 GntR family transcriptional regulator [Streptomyces sp. H39-C1]MDJ0346360.1 GntR family transcriptional regulator [Streptomyces sp. PH10-H1]MDJ0374950.1 GntR family transcriptional regulator [Streptomyces sp. H10-C2]
MTIPIYQRVADDLRGRIVDGSLPPGGQLPTEAELRATYDTTRETVRRGLALLINEGLIVSRRPKGYFVRAWTPMVYRPQSEFKRRPPQVDVFTQLIADEGNGREATQDIGVEIVQPTAAVRDRLQTKEGELVAVRRRTRRIDGDAYNLNDSYVPLALVQHSDWMNPADVPRGTNAVLAELGRELVRALDEIYIRMPRPDETTRLQLGPGTPVAEHIVTTYAADGAPVQVTINIVPGDRHVIVYERVKDAATAEEPRIPWGAQ